MNALKTFFVISLSIIIIIVNLSCSKEKTENKPEVLVNDIELNISERAFLCSKGECIIKVNNNEFNEVVKSKYPNAKSYEVLKIDDINLQNKFRVKKEDKFYFITDDKIYNETVNNLYFELREEPEEIALYFKTSKENNGVCISSKITDISKVSPSIPEGLSIDEKEKNKITELFKNEILNKQIITIDDPTCQTGWTQWDVAKLTENLNKSYNSDVKKYSLNSESYYIIKLIRKDRNTDFLDIACIIYKDKVIHCAHSRINAFFVMNGKFYCNILDWAVYSEGSSNYLVYFDKDKLVHVKLKDID
jgi:hypothetical protein